MLGTGMESLLQDLHHALRRLVHAPAFSRLVFGTLAIGIGGNPAIFSVINAVLLRPLPYPQAGRLTNWVEKGRPGFRGASYPTFKDWQEQSHTVDFLYARGGGLLT